MQWYFTEIGLRSPRYFTDKIDKVFGKTAKPPSFFKNISHFSHLNVETIELLLKVGEKIAYNLYEQNVLALVKQNSELQRQLYEAQRKNIEDAKMILKKESEVEYKDLIIKQKDEKIGRLEKRIETLCEESKKENDISKKKENTSDKQNTKLRKSNQYRPDRKIVEVSVNSVADQTNIYASEARNLIFYDIPKQWKENEVIEALNNIHYVRWYSGSMKLQQIRYCNSWQLTKEIKEEISKKKEAEVRDAAKKYGATFVKIIKVHKKQFLLGYFNNESSMMRALELSMKDDFQDCWKVRSIDEVITKEQLDIQYHPFPILHQVMCLLQRIKVRKTTKMKRKKSMQKRVTEVQDNLAVDIEDLER
ncbi:hypothetical protein GLOIN_2v1643545 [Rhizophagus clarus]|uniref:Uncharacterized protein n=1 Tax=Rhizophagus clarus TaxID=94130 RepID=A0A8H3QED2_9GLOM|nr:hypothetical protein GLOIN_2v1643545 [Rhizophagus clarus]